MVRFTNTALLLATLASSVAALKRTVYPLQDSTIFGGDSELAKSIGSNLVGLTEDGAIRRALLSFDLSSLPNDAVVTKVTMDLDIQKNLGQPEINMYRVTTPWSSGTAGADGVEGSPAHNDDVTWKYSTYSTIPWAQEGGDYDATLLSSEVGDLFLTTKALETTVQGMINGNLPNFGFILIGKEDGAAAYQSFGSMEETKRNHQPRLVVEYDSLSAPTTTKVARKNLRTLQDTDGTDNGEDGVPATDGTDNGADDVPATDGTDNGEDGVPATDGTDNGEDGVVATDGTDNGEDGVPATDGTDNGEDGVVATDGTDNGEDGVVATDGTDNGEDGVATDGTDNGEDGVATDGTDNGEDGVATDGTDNGEDGVATDGTDNGEDGLGGSTGGLCFSGESMVEIQGQGPATIDTLKIGDYVRVENDAFAQVYSFGHSQADVKADYLQISTTDSTLQMSADHMIFTNAGAAVPAKSIKVGDMLLAANGNAAEVSSIKNVVKKGAYAPFTTTGSIVVNGLVASNYISFLENVPMQWIAHSFNAPHRMACAVNFAAFCENETYTSEGMSTWIAAPFRVSQWLMTQSAPVQAVGVATLMATLVVVNMIDALFSSSAVMAAALVLGYFATKKNAAKKVM